MPKKSSNGTKNKDGMPPAPKDGYLVVGIGASAGGIKALKEFFSNVSETSGNVYVVILHLSPQHESQLAEILQLNSRIPVHRIENGRVKVEPNNVYVIPPNKSLLMHDGHLATAEITTHEERRAPVDIFFRTLAESQQSRAVSVILSGTGPDGSMGIKRVKEKGGIIIAQDPKEAEYDDMPRNAIATNLVDYILPAVDIPTRIIEYKKRLGHVEIPEIDEDPEAGDERALAEIFVQIRKRTGHDFSNYKRGTVLRRIERRMNVHGLSDLPAYAGFLKSNIEESRALLKDLLISVTNFFRDRPAFEALEREVIPNILANRGTKDVVRCWVAGCATGEEAFSIAILFAEQTANRLNSPSVQIFATDIDETAISMGRAGLYSKSDVADVSPERLDLFFNKEGENYRVRRELREMVLFANHNVTKDPPFSRLDLVTCRNLLIYLNAAAQERVMETFHFALKPGGFLFLGASESADSSNNLFAPLDKERRIFQSRPIATVYSTPPEVALKLLEIPTRGFAEHRSEEIRALERLSYTALHQHLLEQYAPPSVVVNEEHEILHLSENVGRYLQVTGGEPSKNLLQIARPEIRLELRTALYQAMQRRTPVDVHNLVVNTEKGTETINIRVRPVLPENDPNRGYILIVFEPAQENQDGSISTLLENEPIARKLEEELVRTKSQLRATVEQYEVQHEELRASNEELQAINEELRSAAEEIETSKEELQSVNEELSTVNQELKIKIEELSQSNNDFQNLINSTEVGTIFLDRASRVKLFTNSVTKIFNLIPGDVGRPLSDLTSNLEGIDLEATVRTVLDKLQPIDHEITAEGGSYMMRVLPYRTSEDRIDGVVITFVDITSRLEAETKLRESHERMNELVESISDAFYAVDANSNFIYVNKRAEDMWGRKRKDLLGKNLWTEFPELADSDLYDLHRKALKEKQTIHVETRSALLDGWLDISVYPDTRGGVSYYFRNIDDRKREDLQRAVRQEQLRLIMESATDYAILTVDENNLITSWSQGAELIFGYKANEIVGKPGAILFTGEDRDQGEPEREIDTAGRTGRAEDDRWHVRKDGSRLFVTGVMQPLQVPGGGFVKICRDQTDKIKADTAVRDREMLHQLISTQEDERRRIARDIHDHLGQQMTSLRLKLESVKSMCDEKTICDEIETIQRHAEQIDRDVDFLAWELRPAALDDLGLRVTLSNFVQEWSRYTGTKAAFHSNGLGRKQLPFEIETNLYRIAQEALNNIQKHADAKNVSVLLEKRGNTVTLIVEDDGKGFEPENKQNRTAGMGLIGMRERAGIVGGSVEIESAKGRGTTVFARVPLKIEDKKK